MKANELMIGDWVNPLNEAIQGPCRVLNLGDDVALIGNGPKEWIATTAELEGIPLTAEILEKNGFVYVGSEVYECDVLPFYIWWERDRHRLGIDIEDSTYDKENFGQMLRVPVSYVHELQHALRLCGIEKEITL